MKPNNNTFLFESDRIIDEFDVFFWTFDDASSFDPLHWHRAIEIIYILDGEIDVVLNSQEIVLLPGDIILIDSFVIHATKSINGNKAILIQIPYNLLKRYIPDYDNLRFSFDCHTDDPVLKSKIESFINVIKEMQDAFASDSKGKILRFNSLLFELLYQMYLDFSAPVHDINKKSFDRLNLIMNYTHSHYKSRISLDEISDVAGFQREYFCHFFKKNTGKSYLEYLNEIRLSHIHHDLIYTDLPLNAILESNGFTNYKLFRQLFYKQFLTTPGEYRKTHQPG